MLKWVLTRMQPHSQRGISLVETLAAVAILGTSVVAFVVSLSSGSLAAGELNKETVAQSLVQTQMEYTKAYPFDPIAVTYPTVAAPATYSISVGVSAIPGADSNIQKITVSVLKDSVSLLTIDDYKVNR